MDRRLKLDRDRLAMAFDERSPEVEWDLDRESGEVIAVDYDTWRLLESIEGDALGVVEEPALADRLAGSTLPQWQQDTVLDAARVRDDFPGRFIWYAFQAERTRARFIEWLASEGIEPE